MPGAAAIAASVVLLALGAFQALLAAGRPLGRLAWGGAHDVLPPGLRIASASSIALYALMAVVLLEAGGVLDVAEGGWPRTAAWILAGYFALGTVMNAASRSRDERRVMTPVALALCLLSVAVAAST